MENIEVAVPSPRGRGVESGAVLTLRGEFAGLEGTESSPRAERASIIRCAGSAAFSLRAALLSGWTFLATMGLARTGRGAVCCTARRIRAHRAHVPHPGWEHALACASNVHTSARISEHPGIAQQPRHWKLWWSRRFRSDASPSEDAVVIGAPRSKSSASSKMVPPNSLCTASPNACGPQRRPAQTASARLPRVGAASGRNLSIASITLAAEIVELASIVLAPTRLRRQSEWVACRLAPILESGIRNDEFLIADLPSLATVFDSKHIREIQDK